MEAETRGVRAGLLARENEKEGLLARREKVKVKARRMWGDEVGEMEMERRRWGGGGGRRRERRETGRVYEGVRYLRGGY